MSNGLGVRAVGGAVAINGPSLRSCSENGVGFSAIDGGTVSLTGTGHTIQSVSRAAVQISNTAIGSAGVTFQSLASTGANSGIILDGTGSAGGLTVSGNGGVCTPLDPSCTGGTIQSTSGDGISLTDTRSPSFASMHILSTAGNGVDGTTTTNFAFNNGFIEDSGTAHGADAANISFGDFETGTERNLSGVVSITGNILRSSYFYGIDILDFDGTISAADISANTISSDATEVSSMGSGIRLVAVGSDSSVANVTRANIANNTVTDFPGLFGIVVSGGNAHLDGPAGIVGVANDPTDVVTITGNQVAGPSASAGFAASAIIVNVAGSGQGNFDVSANGTLGNPVGNSTDAAIAIQSAGFAIVTATADGNVIAAHNDAGAPGIAATTGRIFSSADTPWLAVRIEGNTINETNGNGILVAAHDATGHLDATIWNNAVTAPLGAGQNGIRIDAGNIDSADDSVCLSISNNSANGTTLLDEGIGLYKQGSTTTTNDFGIEGMNAAAASPDVETYVDAQNPQSSVGGSGRRTILLSATSGFANCATAP